MVTMVTEHVYTRLWRDRPIFPALFSDNFNNFKSVKFQRRLVRFGAGIQFFFLKNVVAHKNCVLKMANITRVSPRTIVVKCKNHCGQQKQFLKL
jgi:hypothetical protein